MTEPRTEAGQQLRARRIEVDDMDSDEFRDWIVRIEAQAVESLSDRITAAEAKMDQTLRLHETLDVLVAHGEAILRLQKIAAHHQASIRYLIIGVIVLMVGTLLVSLGSILR